MEKNPLEFLKQKPTTYPNKIYITIKGNKDCVLDIVAQLTI